MTTKNLIQTLVTLRETTHVNLINQNRRDETDNPAYRHANGDKCGLVQRAALPLTHKEMTKVFLDRSRQRSQVYDLAKHAMYRGKQMLDEAREIEERPEHDTIKDHCEGIITSLKTLEANEQEFLPKYETAYRLCGGII